MEDNIHKKLTLLDRSYTGILKKETKDLALKCGFTGSRLGELEVVVSELLSNLVKYADQKGEFLVRKITKVNVPGLEIICIDKGKGIANVERMLQDGISTSGSLGQGLGAINRLSDEFDLYSLPDWGTIILSRMYIKKNTSYENKKEVEVGVVTVPADQQEECGDNWKIITKANHVYIMAVDGLGHGSNASEAAKEAVKSFEKNVRFPTHELLQHVHQDIRKTRGAVCFSAVADYKNNTIRYAGVGNISARLISKQGGKNCISYNGIVGYIMPRTMNESNIIWSHQDIFIMCSDGITSRWSLGNYPDIIKHDPVIIAAALYKDYRRTHDDSLVIVLKRK